jgi:hypothetical protein
MKHTLLGFLVGGIIGFVGGFMLLFIRNHGFDDGEKNPGMMGTSGLLLLSAILGGIAGVAGAILGALYGWFINRKK